MNTAITAVLLAGGESTRFNPLEEKNIFSFLGKTFLTWHYEQLAHFGIDHVIVVTNEKNDALIRGVAVPEKMRVSYVVQKQSGQVQAVLALEQICSHHPVLFLNASDYYSDTCIASFLKEISASEKRIVLGAVKTSVYFPGGYLKLDDAGDVSEIVEKPVPGTQPSDVVRILVDFFPDAADFITTAKKFAYDAASGYEQAINACMTEEHAHVIVTDKEQWKPIKYPWNALDVMDQLLMRIEGQQIDDSVLIKQHVIIEGPVIIESGVKIYEGTKIVGPVYIGKNTIIGNNNIIRSSAIGSDCVTGFNTDITRSLIGNGCWFHTNYVGDSVIGNNVSMGSGTVTANLRLDDGTVTSIVKEEKIDSGRNKLGVLIGDNVRIGVNVSTMPGIKIGADSFVAAGIVVSRDIPAGSFVRPVDTGFMVLPNKKHASTSREGFRKAI